MKDAADEGDGMGRFQRLLGYEVPPAANRIDPWAISDQMLEIIDGLSLVFAGND